MIQNIKAFPYSKMLTENAICEKHCGHHDCNEVLNTN